MVPAFINWSGGKDCSLTLFKVLKEQKYDVKYLLTSVNDHHKRISMHGVREELLNAQSAALNIPLQTIRLPEMPTMEVYDEAMKLALQKIQSEGIKHSVFGDIFLEDLRKYRDEKLASVGMSGVYPVWKRDTRELFREFIDLGFKARTVCVKASLLPKEFCGRLLDEDFLKELPANVDPCGENGEFHTYVFDGPIYDAPIPIEVGETIYRAYDAPKNEEKEAAVEMGFWFTDLRLKN